MQTEAECFLWRVIILSRGFPSSSAGKESAGNAGDLGLIPGSGRSAREGMNYPLQYSWASLMTQLVMNSCAAQETWVRSLSWEDPLEKGKATHSSILSRRTPWIVQSMGSQRVGHDWVIFTSTFFLSILSQKLSAKIWTQPIILFFFFFL